ncbi:hypothetical protein F5Y15DRAFT_166345 [Xylariaceae sp. FL0016]|nr:hypothetical protein F5Y15DRAFT_166345 [Xylariaceae sp. FL0016]
MPREVIILAGAPEAKNLSWTETELLDRFLEPIAKFAHLEESLLSPVAGMISTPDTAVWRSIPLVKERLPTGFSQMHELNEGYHENPGFFTTLSRSFDDTSVLTEGEQSHKLLSRFYDHSLAIHDDIRSSQLPTSSLSTDEPSVDTTDPMTTGMSTQGSARSVPHLRHPAVESGHLSDLEDLPNAAYLESISPQTVTVNLIAGVISVAEPRTVKTRWGKSMSLIELLVGDETKSGFGITFWLSPEHSDSGAMLKTLRRQDIILIRNVALGAFAKKVYGHSLRKGHTKIDLLYRRRLDREDQGGFYSTSDVSRTGNVHPQLVKTRHVWKWVIDFVGGGPPNLGKRDRNGKMIRRWDLPPEDSQ